MYRNKKFRLTELNICLLSFTCFSFHSMKFKETIFLEFYSSVMVEIQLISVFFLNKLKHVEYYPVFTIVVN